MGHIAPELVGASFGYVLFGYLMVLPLWAAGALWNRRASRRLNAWTLPLAWMVFVLMCGAIKFAQGEAGAEDEIVALGLIPCTLGCLVGWWKYRKPGDHPVSVAD